MATSITLVRVDHPPGGGLTINYSNSESSDFPSAAVLAEFAGQGANDDTDLCKRSLIRRWLDQDPDAANDNLIEGRTAVYDPSKDVMLQIS